VISPALIINLLEKPRLVYENGSCLLAYTFRILALLVVSHLPPFSPGVCLVSLILLVTHGPRYFVAPEYSM
jgi:hypothetical protein